MMLCATVWKRTSVGGKTLSHILWLQGPEGPGTTQGQQCLRGLETAYRPCFWPLVQSERFLAGASTRSSEGCHFKFLFGKGIRIERIYEFFKRLTLSPLAGTEESAIQLWQIQHAHSAKRKGVGHGTLPFLDGIRSLVKSSPRIASLLSLLAYSCWACAHKGKTPELECASPCAHARDCSGSSDVSKMETGHTTICSLSSWSMVSRALHLPFLDAGKHWAGLRFGSSIQSPDCILSASNNMASANPSCPLSSHQPVSSSPNSWFLSVSLVPASGMLPWPHADTHMFSWMLPDEFQPWNTASSHPSPVPKPLRVPYCLPHEVFNFPALLSRPTSVGTHSVFPV